ncbi:hypothetical protein [Cysteiniphilum sp. QT6929]|uniref:hypothetical protein n=1 Tax=Cysteiniphilum sp. QT6929 TaxID=2975055 RepID=UPI0024B35584|nr:hypothetical protein [Cysteiniphilum sp. QT6929]WHN66365.1 hypothetical protein NYP54_03810 [Cysteiniphilum sp. QT6929]
MNNCTVVVCSCDDYDDVWELFFCSFKDNWEGCEYDLLLNTESKQIDIDWVKAVNSNYLKGRDKWGERLINVLRSVSTKYVIVLYDDYVLSGKVDSDEISKCISRMEVNENIAAFYLTNCSPHDVQDGEFPKFNKVADRADYKLNSAPAVWNRVKLLSYLQEEDTPWAWEYFGSYRAYETKDIFYQVKIEEDDIYPYFTEGGAIYRGKWQEKFVKPLIEKYNLNLDLSKRGCSQTLPSQRRRSLKWKVDFFRKGFNMIGFAVIIFMFRIVKEKIKKKFINL